MMVRYVFIVVLGGIFFLSSQSAMADQVKIYTLTPKKIHQYIQGKKGQKKILYLYTSWCPYCVEKMPQIMDLERTKKGSVIAIALDENYSDYARYARKLKGSPFPLILNDGAENTLKKTIKDYIVKPWTGYPTIVFLDANNKPVSQGNYTAEQAADFLFK